MPLKIYFFSSLVYVLLGISHLIAHWYVMYGLQGSLIYLSMQMVTLKVLFTHRNLVEFLNGFSITLGFFMVSYGLLNLILWKQFKELLLQNRLLLILNSIVSFTISLLSLLYLVYPAVFFFFLVGVAFGYLAVRGGNVRRVE